MDVSRKSHALRVLLFAAILAITCLCLIAPRAAFAATSGLTLDPYALGEGSTFTAPVSHTADDGTTDTVDCQFAITGTDTCRVIGAGVLVGARAVDTATTGTITIPATVTADDKTYTVTAVGNYAFGGASGTACSALEGIVLPSTIQSIGDYAFCYCSALASINFPAGLTTIGPRSFYYCSALSKLDFSSTLTSIGTYAFCRCSGLATVIFEGDAPTIGDYAFTGGGVAIKKLVFMGASITPTLDKFNSESAGLPTCYYTVTFYKSKDYMDLGGGVVGKATIANTTPYRNISIDLVSKDIYAGSIPDWPTGTNLWVFEFSEDDDGIAETYNSTISQSGKAYPIQSAYRDLSTATVTFKYAPNYTFSYLGTTTDFGAKVTDLIGGVLEEGTDYTLSYKRDGKTTTDLVTPGTITITATATTGSRYTGSVSADITITFADGADFAYPVDVISASGATSTELCWFKLSSLTDTTGDLQVYCGSELLPERFPRAVPTYTSGTLVLPSTITLFGRTLTIRSIGDYAFGYVDTKTNTATCSELTGIQYPSTLTAIGTGAFRGCRGFRAVSIPANIVSIGQEAFLSCSSLATLDVYGSSMSVGTDAFRECDDLTTIRFYGNASKIGWGTTVFKYDTGIEDVVYYGKAASSYHLFASGSPTYSSDPNFYYMVTFYASKDDATSGTATPLSTATLRGDIKLAFLSQVKDYASGLYAGSIPDYPSSLVDDGKWLAPTWVFPEVNADNTVALASTLSDSVYAYAAQSNDAYTVSDAIVTGITDGAKFDYTGAALIDRDKITVASAVGRPLVEGTDYTMAFQRESDTEKGVWADTTDFTSGGEIRMIITGIGKYSGNLVYSVTINANAEKTGSIFKADIPLVTSAGVSTTVSCLFQVTAMGDTTTGTPNTVDVYRPTNGTAAIDTATAGSLTIPHTVHYNGVAYSVTGIDAYAFQGCSNLTAVTTPTTVASIGQYAFGYCGGLTSATVGGASPSDVYCFAGCGRLRSVTLGENVTGLGSFFFTNCGTISSFVYTDKLTITAANAFYNTTLSQLNVSKTFMAALSQSALNNATVVSATFEDGVTEIGNAFYGKSTLQSVTLPATLEKIDDSAFAGTGITKVEFPDATFELGAGAFTSCTSLTTVIFDGDPNDITYTRAFAASRNIKSVVYRGPVLQTASTLFTASTPTYYSTVTFYANADAQSSGTVLSKAAIKLGTPLSSIDVGTVAASDIYDGSIPAHPDGTNIWEFEGNPPLCDTLSDSVYAFGKQIDLKDLSNGRAIPAQSAYHYTGTALDPFQSTLTKVVDARGKTLTRGTDYTVTFQRRDTNGVWQDTTDITSRGHVRIVATATSASGYTGSAIGSYVIADYIAGDTFTAADVNGHLITYKVLTAADETDPGTVQVGLASKTGEAVDESTSGAVVIPETVSDPAGGTYAPTAIADYAFYRRMSVTEVDIPSQVTRIGRFAFAYENVKTDTQVSTLATVVFANDMAKTTVGGNAFLNCDAIRTVVYRQKKGSYADFGGSTDIQYYYTASYYLSKDDLAAGRKAASVTVKDGSYLFSLSKTDYYAGSGTAPDLAEGCEWRYDATALDAEECIHDSMDVYERKIDDSTVTADVTLITPAGETTTTSCSFRRLKDADGAWTGGVELGTEADGSPAVDRTTAGTLIIPSSITASDGTVYPVVAVSSYALGASEETGACTAIVGVELPASVSTIGQAAFAGCTALSQVTFADKATLATIGSNAFSGCTALSSVSLPASLTTISTAAFAGSGLTHLYVPYAVSTMGKRAFDGCARLMEVVFGGRMGLDLTALSPLSTSGLLGDAVASTIAGAASAAPQGDVTNASNLTLLDDYAFAGCTSLSRIVFDADVSSLTVSDVAFEGDSSVKAVVFGDRRATFTLPGSTPDVYLTMSYFTDAEAESVLDRCGYVVVRAGTTFASRTEGDVYAGSEPDPGQYREWVYGRSVTSAMSDSAYAYGRKIRYDIGTSAVDAAFACTSTVAGEPVTSATYGDTVSMSITSAYAVQPTGFTVTDRATGQVLLTVTDGTTGTFSMPGSAVDVAVTAAAPLTVSTQSTRAGLVQVAALSLADMRQLAGTQQTTLDFTAWNRFREPTITRTGSYVTLANLLAHCGVTFDSGDSLIFYSGSTMVGSISYDKLYASTRYSYPSFISGEVDDAVQVEPVLAMTSAEASGSAAKSGTFDPASLACAYRFCFGQTAEEMSASMDTESSFASQVTSIVVLAGAQDIAGYTFGDLDKTYAYTGSPVDPKVTLTAPDGTALTEGRDFEVAYADDVEAGVATLTVSGIGDFRGTLSSTYRIVRAQEFAGPNRYATSAETALEAYPQGSAGVIVAAGGNFADALSASGLCGLLGYPLLLTAQDALPASVADAVTYLSLGRSGFQVIIIGGEGSVSSNVETAIGSLVGSGSDVSRLGGSSRYQTAYLVYLYGSQTSGGWSRTAILANGTSFADALSISSYSAFAHAPILLTDGTGLDALTDSALTSSAFDDAVVVGGTSAVSPSLEATLTSRLGTGHVTRLAGQNRYATSLTVATWELAHGLDAGCVGVATGANFPDGLSAISVLGTSGHVLLLAADGDTSAFQMLSDDSSKVNRLCFFGGTASTSTSVRTAALDALGWDHALLP